MKGLDTGIPKIFDFILFHLLSFTALPQGLEAISKAFQATSLHQLYIGREWGVRTMVFKDLYFCIHPNDGWQMMDGGR